MIIGYYVNYIIGILVFVFLVLIVLKLIWDIGIPILKLIIIFLLVLFGVKYIAKHVLTTDHKVIVNTESDINQIKGIFMNILFTPDIILGFLLILWGSSILARIIWHIDIPIFKPLLAITLIYLGMQFYSRENQIVI